MVGAAHGKLGHQSACRDSTAKPVMSTDLQEFLQEDDVPIATSLALHVQPMIQFLISSLGLQLDVSRA